MEIKSLNIFYEEPDPDRWFKYDRYPRKLIRNLWRGKQRPGGVMMIALELKKGLDLLGIPYRFNDYKYAAAHPDELIGVIGKPHLIFEKKFKNPILFGAGIYSHPIDCPDLFDAYPNVLKMLVPGPWMEKMCVPFYGDKVQYWPAGIDTNKWDTTIKVQNPAVDFLIYDKILWEYPFYEKTLLNPIINKLEQEGLKYDLIRYGSYTHKGLIEKLSQAKAVIFLCEHETQGLAYQQILATNTPILAWNEMGYWKDPAYYPHKVKYKPVSSVPYWDKRCGLEFTDTDHFNTQLPEFIAQKNVFEPRKYILDHLTLEKSAAQYYKIFQELNLKISSLGVPQ